MNRKPRFATNIRDWRLHRGLTLRDLAARLTDDQGRPLISYASLGRIERGLQPYSQPVVEAIAEALGTLPGALIDTRPETFDGFVTVWSRLSREQQYQAIAIMRIMAGGK